MKLNTVKYILMIMSMIIIFVFVKVFEGNDLLIGIGIGLALILLVIALFIEMKINKNKEALIKEEEKKRKDIVVNYLYEHQNDDHVMGLIYEIYSKEILELNAYIDSKNLDVDLDYSKEDKYFELCISKTLKSVEDSYYLALCYEEEWYLVLNYSDSEIKINNMSKNEILELILDDIRRF